MQRAQQGDDAALDELIRIHLPALRAFIRAKSGPVLKLRESSSDLVQTVCREALQSLGDYEWAGAGSFRYWLFTLAQNKLRNRVDYHVARRRDPAREDADPDQHDAVAEVYRTVWTPSQHAIANELVQSVESALDRLEPEHREVIVLSRIVGLTHRQIATHMDRSEGAVRMLLHRALARLAAAMEAVDP